MKTSPYIFSAVFIAVFFASTAKQFVFPNNRPKDPCIDLAVARIDKIKELPAKQYLATLDGKNVLLSRFYELCEALFPQCAIFEKFYHWENEVREITSITPRGPINHNVRVYYNSLSTCCPGKCLDPLKTHGDVAEIYDETGEFMGLGVYMGAGKYCSLPHHGYRK